MRLEFENVLLGLVDRKSHSVIDDSNLRKKINNMACLVSNKHLNDWYWLRVVKDSLIV
jgi:hypothetical protein